MRRKILWITFGTTMAFWFGCAGGRGGGDDQNYKVLEEDRPMLQPERGTGGNGGPGISFFPAEWRFGTLATALAQETGATGEEAEPTEMTTSTTQPAVLAPVGDTEPSVVSLDRSNWPTIRVRPEDGRTWHGPVYFEDRPIGSDRRNIDRSQDPDQQLQAALSGADRSQFYTRENLKHTFIQPLEFAKDLVLLPYRMVMQPPWELTHTP
jgi:hypothetical protein